MTSNIEFQSLSFMDVPLMHKWFNTPHVQKFYSLRNWSEDEVLKKLHPYIVGEKPVWPFIALYNRTPIGYVQFYQVADFPWPEQGLSGEVIQQGAGMDLFIGEESYLGKGFGKKIILQFIETKIWPKFNYCVVDPDIENEPAIHCYEKLGFKMYKKIKTDNALGQPVELLLMLLEKSKVGEK